MKKLIQYSFIFILAISMFACKEDAEKFAIGMEGLDQGGAMPVATFHSERDFNFGDLNNSKISFTADVSTVGKFGKFKSLVISKSYNGSAKKVFMTIPAAELPKKIEITPAIAAEGFRTLSQIEGGDAIRFSFMVEFDEPGFSFNGTAISEAFPDFTSNFLCPANTFKAQDMAGTYIITDEKFVEVEGEEVVLTAGPGQNQLTINDPYKFKAHGNYNYKVILTVDPITNQITVDKQEAWDTAVFGMAYGIASVSGTGTAFPCANSIALSLNHTVSAGSFGTKAYKIKKK